MTDRVFIIHTLDHATAALTAARELGVPVTLRSAAGAAAYLGAAVFRDIVAAAEATVPGVEVTAILDCGDDPGLALNALRQGVKGVRLEAPGDVRDRVADIAAQVGGVLAENGPACDLLNADDVLAASRAWLSASG